MIGAAIVFCLPMFMALLAVIYQLVGDWYCMLAFFSLLLSLLIWLPLGDLAHDEKAATDNGGIDSNGVLAPQSHTAASAEFVCRGRVSNLFKLLTVAFLVLFVLNLANELDDEEKQVGKVWTATLRWLLSNNGLTRSTGWSDTMAESTGGTGNVQQRL